MEEKAYQYKGETFWVEEIADDVLKVSDSADMVVIKTDPEALFPYSIAGTDVCSNNPEEIVSKACGVLTWRLEQRKNLLVDPPGELSKFFESL